MTLFKGGFLFRELAMYLLKEKIRDFRSNIQALWEAPRSGRFASLGKVNP